VFFETLRACGALKVVFPEVDALFGIPQPEKWHPEIDTGLHTMMVLDASEKISSDPAVRFACLVHDLGKATTRKDKLPSHPGHEMRSVNLIKAMAQRLPLPKSYRELAVIVAEYHSHCHREAELKDSTVVRVLEKTDAFRRPERFENFLLACEADARGRAGLEDRDYPQADAFRAAHAAASAIKASEIAAANDAARIAEAIRNSRVAAVHKLRSAG
jgi:tRNA nucleotidyltransferase (CCA-adding enzyme)